MSTPCSWCIDEGNNHSRADHCVHGLLLCFRHSTILRGDIDRLERLGNDDPEYAHGVVDDILTRWAPVPLREAVRAVEARQPWWAGA